MIARAQSRHPDFNRPALLKIVGKAIRLIRFIWLEYFTKNRESEVF